jgi:aspartyl/glutamyl-tRNA(Asn/Gln) amidotransferase C subunit
MNNYIEKIALISRIKLNEKDEIKMEKGINEVVDYAKIIMNVGKNSYSNNSYNEKTQHNLINKYREDASEESGLNIKIIENAPSSIDTFFQVPALIDRS